ncbi:MAG: hypothetical protein V3T28_05170 [Gemmatimonadales bacterium]
MRRGAAHLTIVLGDPAKADELRAALDRHGVDHAAVVTQPRSIRRSLVLGENDFVVVCIALDGPTIRKHGNALRSLLSDHRCFPTAMRTVGLLSDLGLTREVAELGCDVYVEDSAHAATAIRLLEEGWATDERRDEPRRRMRIRGGWMQGSPDLPAELTSLVSTGQSATPNPKQGPWPVEIMRRFKDPDSSSTHPRDNAGEDFGDHRGPP